MTSGSQGANFTAGVREREDANLTREAGDSVLVKTKRAKLRPQTHFESAPFEK
jgi:hypothetical protein